ncbi:hypothetical protein ACG7TL_005518 [Trametes sanguinea]
MQVPVHPSSFVGGQPITPMSWPRKLPRPTHISINTSRRPASADSTCTTSSSLSVPSLPSPISPSSSTSSLPSPHSARPESEVQRAVSRLLSLTKQLQEVISLWAHGSAGNADVSDAFVLVGSQFDSTVHAFWRVGVDMSFRHISLGISVFAFIRPVPLHSCRVAMSPLVAFTVVDCLRTVPAGFGTDGGTAGHVTASGFGPALPPVWSECGSSASDDLFHIPLSLRSLLEGMLAEKPSPDVLAHYSPRIRKLVVDLLQGLQAKQSPYWAAVARTKDSNRLSVMPGTTNYRPIAAWNCVSAGCARAFAIRVSSLKAVLASPASPICATSASGDLTSSQHPAPLRYVPHPQ